MSRASDSDRTPTRPERLRRIDGSSTFMPHRFLGDGFWASLTRDELLLYILLVLVADRKGMSLYFDDPLWALLRVMPEQFHAARAGLVRKDPVAYDRVGPRYQVLSLPARPVIGSAPGAGATAESRGGAPTHIRELIRDFLARMDREDL